MKYTVNGNARITNRNVREHHPDSVVIERNKAENII